MENNQLGPRPAKTPLPRLSRARQRVLAVLVDQGGPRTIAELHEATGLHANTLRGHLDALTDQGLLERERRNPIGRGRPAWQWSVPTQPHNEYAGLAAALARTLKTTSEHPAADAIEAGRTWGHELAESHQGPEGDARGRTIGLLDDLGFAPRNGAGRTGAPVRLTRCPLLEAAREEPTIVCNVHLGLVAGALEGYDAADPDVALTPFAEPGACLLRISTD